MYGFRTRLRVMSRGFHACDPLRTHDLFMSYDWFRHVAQLTLNESSDGFHTMSHFES